MTHKVFCFRMYDCRKKKKRLFKNSLRVTQMLAFGGLFGALVELGIRQGLTFEQTTSVLVTVGCVFGAISAGILMAFGYQLATKFITFAVAPIIKSIAQAVLAVVKYIVGKVGSLVVNILVVIALAYVVHTQTIGRVPVPPIDYKAETDQIMTFIRKAGEIVFK